MPAPAQAAVCFAVHDDDADADCALLAQCAPPANAAEAISTDVIATAPAIFNARTTEPPTEGTLSGFTGTAVRPRQAATVAWILRQLWAGCAQPGVTSLYPARLRMLDRQELDLEHQAGSSRHPGAGVAGRAPTELGRHDEEALLPWTHLQVRLFPGRDDAFVPDDDAKRHTLIVRGPEARAVGFEPAGQMCRDRVARAWRHAAAGLQHHEQKPARRTDGTRLFAHDAGLELGLVLGALGVAPGAERIAAAECGDGVERTRRLAAAHDAHARDDD